MTLFELLRQRVSMRHLVSVAREIAAASQNDVWQRTHELLFEMELPEARGYIRVRAAKIIRQYATDAMVQHPPMDDTTKRLLLTLATERVVHLVLTDFVSSSTAARREAA